MGISANELIHLERISLGYPLGKKDKEAEGDDTQAILIKIKKKSPQVPKSRADRPCQTSGSPLRDSDCVFSKAR